MIDRPLYVDKIMAYTDTPFVKILTGVRRCGKSTILKMIMEKLKTERNIPEERIVSFRYDSMEYEDMTAKQMYMQLKERLYPGGKTYLFLDEVQEIKGWERVVNSLLSGSRKRSWRIISAWEDFRRPICRRFLRMKFTRLSGISITPRFFRIL